MRTVEHDAWASRSFNDKIVRARLYRAGRDERSHRDREVHAIAGKATNCDHDVSGRGSGWHRHNDACPAPARRRRPGAIELNAAASFRPAEVRTRYTHRTTCSPLSWA